MTKPTAPEFSCLVDIREADGRAMTLEPSASEREALARRFGLIRIDSLVAEVMLERHADEVAVTGSLRARIVQSCAVSAEDLAAAIDEPLRFRFVPARTGYRPDDEIELDSQDCDEIEFVGTNFDLGEAVAQSLGLAIDPFAVGPDAETARRAGLLGSEQDSGPFAVLKALKPQ